MTDAATTARSRTSIARRAISVTLVGGRWRWLRPLIAAIAIGGVGLWLISIVESAMRDKLESELRTVLAADVGALNIWLKSQKETADAISTARLLPGWIERLDAMATRGESVEALRQAAPQQALRALLDPLCRKLGFVGYVVVDREGRWIADGMEEFIGMRGDASTVQYVNAVLAGNVIVSPPFFHDHVPDEDGVLGRRPVMFVGAPVRRNDGTPFAVLALIIRPEHEFTQILGVARSGESGETYAFDANGLMLSDSRFNDQMRTIGLLPNEEDVRAILRVQIRDPGGNMLDGHRPSGAIEQLPLTRMAASAVTGADGVDVEGYRDYRGVHVVGAWTWLDEFNFGVATEMDHEEAYRAAGILRTAFWVLFGLLFVAGTGAAAASGMISLLRKRVDHAEQEARRLGQYTLGKKIGEGGMGEVYLARHALLRRPTAVKILRKEVITDESVRRFEHEVQLTSRLTHPNTVSVFDYGRTSEGTFYYAMEYLTGLSLDTLVEREGPLPEGRVIHILQQACASLEEAHAAKFIHRDIKPANLMLCQLGTRYDVVKVLDFGLVKDTDRGRNPELTDATVIRGTPLYIAPEAITSSEDIGPRSDIYCLGAVGYFLLTGAPPFEGDKPMDVLLQHVQSEVPPMSRPSGQRVDPELESVLRSCLAKDPTDRPKDTRALDDRLGACAPAGTWKRADAVAWWEPATATTTA